MTEEHFYKIFQQSIEAKMNAGEQLFPDILQAGQMMVDCLLDDGKILSCGNGNSAAIAQILTNNLISRFERERPSLPAFTLGRDITAVTSIANTSSFNEVFAKEVRALGNDNDVLVILSSSGNPSNLIQAVQAAHERNMSVIIFNGRDGGNVASLLDINDKEIRVPHDSRTRIHEIFINYFVFAVSSMRLYLDL